MKKLIVAIYLITIVAAIGALSSAKKTDVQLNNNVKITAAHIDKVKGYTKVYSDTNRDVAYFVKNVPELSTVKLQPVKISGLQDCEIIEATSGAFLVSTKSIESIDTGLSGTLINTLDNQPIGFVSAIKSAGILECKTLE